jgi:hypothetical protein
MINANAWHRSNKTSKELDEIPGGRAVIPRPGRRTASSTDCAYSQTAIAAHRIATPDRFPHPIFGTTFSRPLFMRLSF